MKTLTRMKLLVELGKSPESYRGQMPPTTERKRSRSVEPRKTILVVDDQPEMIESISDILTHAGYRPLGASSVKEGIAMLQRHTDISLIVCDLMMPEKDGFSMLQYVKDNLRFCNIPTIVCSSTKDSDAIEKAVRIGVRGYLIKPFTSERLLSKIQGILDAGLGTVLVVTEDSATSKLLASAISRTGYRALLAESGAKALEVLSQETVHGVLSELALTDMTGLNLMDQSQELRPGLPVMFIEDHLLKIEERDIIAAGGCGMLLKPFDSYDVARKVTQLHHGRRPLHDPPG